MKPDRKTKTFETLIQISQTEEDKIFRKMNFVQNNQKRLLEQIQKLIQAQTHYQQTESLGTFHPELLINQRNFCTNLQLAVNSLEQQAQQLQKTLQMLETQWIEQKNKTNGYQKLIEIHKNERLAQAAKMEQRNTDEIALMIHAWGKEKG